MRRAYTIPRIQAEKIIRDAIALSTNVRVDQLDCSVSFARQPTHKTVEEVIQIGLKDRRTLWNFIFRDAICGDFPHFDVGLSTILIDSPDYFLWIKLSIDDGFKLIKKYKLKAK